MKSFQEITLRPTEINRYFIWQKLFQKIHLKLVNLKDDKGTVYIGISFPEYKCKDKIHLGSKLRLFAPDEDKLKSFNTSKVLNHFSNYIHWTDIRATPDKYRHAVYWRKQPKSSLLRIARRKAKREGLSHDEALEKIKEFSEHRIKTPYINIKSSSSGHPFRLFITKKIVNKPTKGIFNCYGLSPSTTVPEF